MNWSFLATRFASTMAETWTESKARQDQGRIFQYLTVKFDIILIFLTGECEMSIWLQEGDDVYFDCEIQANPRVHEIVWKHNVRKSPKEKINLHYNYKHHDFLSILLSREKFWVETVLGWSWTREIWSYNKFQKTLQVINWWSCSCNDDHWMQPNKFQSF